MPRTALTILALFAAVYTTPAFADEDCTKEPKDKWLTEVQIKEKIDAAGYTKYEKVLVSGSCYEIYGYNKDGKMVEVYFNPIDGAIFKEEVEGK